MLSLTCKTAIKAVIYLASKFESGEKAGIKEIAEFIGASEHTVGKMLQSLVKEEVINNVVEAIDGKDVFKQCGLGLSKCSSSHPCPIHDDYKVVRDLFEKMCRDKKLNDLCEPVNSGLTYLFG